MIKDKNLNLYETLAHEVAMDAAAKRELTDEQREISKRLLAKTHERLAQLEQAKRAKTPRKVRAEFEAMERPTLLSRLRELFTGQPRAALAFRDLDMMSDDDLRITLEDATALNERMS
jgi:hypothetical protein